MHQFPKMMKKKLKNKSISTKENVDDLDSIMQEMKLLDEKSNQQSSSSNQLESIIDEAINKSIEDELKNKSKSETNVTPAIITPSSSSSSLRIPGKNIHSCGNVYNCQNKGEGYLLCSKCKHLRYCSKECQLADWPDHKTNCAELKARRLLSLRILGKI